MTDLSTFAELASVDHGLCVFSTLRGDGSAQASVVNAGVLQHPLTGVQLVGLVAAGASGVICALIPEPPLLPAPAGSGLPSKVRRS